MIHNPKRARAALFAVAGGLSAFPAFAAADAAAGREAAAPCRVCHGLDGQGTNPTIPNIGGQSEQYLVKQLQDFRAGRRENEQMTIIAEGLSDEAIVDLAAWYAAIEVTVRIPE